MVRGCQPHTHPSKLEDYPLSAACSCLFNLFIAALHSWRLSLQLQPEDVPRCGDRDPPDMENSELIFENNKYKIFHCFAVEKYFGNINFKKIFKKILIWPTDMNSYF
jgi:hypothetical protein